MGTQITVRLGFLPIRMILVLTCPSTSQFLFIYYLKKNSWWRWLIVLSSAAVLFSLVVASESRTGLFGMWSYAAFDRHQAVFKANRRYSAIY